MTDTQIKYAIAQWGLLNSALHSLRQASRIRPVNPDCSLALADALAATEIAHELLYRASEAQI